MLTFRFWTESNKNFAATVGQCRNYSASEPELFGVVWKHIPNDKFANPSPWQTYRSMSPLGRVDIKKLLILAMISTKTAQCAVKSFAPNPVER